MIMMMMVVMMDTIIHTIAPSSQPCIKGEGDAERKRIGRVKTVMSVIGKLAKFIPLILCLVITTNAEHYFKR